ncbi:MAG: hypothetical protein JST85_08830 [Acidobacteria bacterium]|nr:hypothetical protein [Acidobacteriota bacterium]
MNKHFRLFYRIASYLLLVSGFGHAVGHYRFYVDRSWFPADRQSVANAMQAYVADSFLHATMWTLLQMFSLSFSLFFLFAGLINLLLLGGELPPEFMKRAARFNLIFWLIALGVFLALHRVIQPIVICSSVSLMFALAWGNAESTEKV